MITYNDSVELSRCSVGQFIVPEYQYVQSLGVLALLLNLMHQTVEHVAQTLVLDHVVAAKFQKIKLFSETKNVYCLITLCRAVVCCC